MNQYKIKKKYPVGTLLTIKNQLTNIIEKLIIIEYSTVDLYGKKVLWFEVEQIEPQADYDSDYGVTCSLPWNSELIIEVNGDPI